MESNSENLLEYYEGYFYNGIAFYVNLSFYIRFQNHLWPQPVFLNFRGSNLCFVRKAIFFNNDSFNINLEGIKAKDYSFLYNNHQVY